MSTIPTLKDRLKQVNTEADLRTQLQQALQTLQMAQQEAKRGLPLELRHVPKAERMVPHLFKKVNRARQTHDRLRAGFAQYSAMLKQGKPLV